MTIIGLYQYDPNLFYYLQLPEDMNKSTLIDTILMKCGQFEVLYPDPEFMQQMLRIWSEGCQDVWKHLYDTMHYEYNPIWNKDGTYTEERTLNEERSGKATGQGETTGHVSAFNTAGWQNSTRSNTGSTVTNNETGKEGEKIIRKEQGNIGVTTTQQMIREEREIAEFNLYDYIAEDFKNRFCLLIY